MLGPDAPAAAQTGTSANTATRVTIPRRILPYMVVSTEPRATHANSPIGGYTRLELTYQAPSDAEDGDRVTPRIYREERRDGLRRWLMGKAITRVVQIRSTLAKPNVTTTMPLASIGRESNQRVGETWNTEFTNQRTLTPFFRIDPESTINVEAEFTLSSTYDASVTKAILDVIRQGAKLVAPTASLLTSENEGRYKEASNFVDSSISSLLRESIVEKSANDFALKHYAGAPLMTLDVYAPIGNKITPGRKTRADQQPRRIGTWTVRSVKPILSVFSDVLWDDTPDGVAEPASPRARPRKAAAAAPDPCKLADPKTARACRAFRNLDPQTVLNFEVDQKKPVAAALAAEQAIVSARDALIKAKAAEAKAPAQTLCALVTNKAYQLGFNRFDVAAIVWAYASQNNLTTNAAALRDKANCGVLTLAYEVGLPQGNFVTN